MMVLSTKQLNANRIKRAKEAFGMDLVCKSFTKIKRTDFLCSPFTLETYDSIAFTSANAVHYFLENMDHKLLANKNIFALQGATREALLLKDIVPNIIAPNVDELGKRIKWKKEELNIQRMLHPIGNLTLPDLGYVVTGAGMTYQELNVYHTELNPVPVDAIPFKAILFFSPSAIDSFSMANRFSSERVYACIGNTTFTRLQYYTDTSNAVIAKNPTPEAMLMALSKKMSND